VSRPHVKRLKRLTAPKTTFSRRKPNLNSFPERLFKSEMLPTGRAVRVRRIFLGSAHPIPTDLEAVKVLSGAPAVLDLFMWLCYRCFVSRGQESIPLFGQYSLTTQLGSVEYSRPGASGRCWISGWEWFEQFGRNVRRRSVAMVSR